MEYQNIHRYLNNITPRSCPSLEFSADSEVLRQRQEVKGSPAQDTCTALVVQMQRCPELLKIISLPASTFRRLPRLGLRLKLQRTVRVRMGYGERTSPLART